MNANELIAVSKKIEGTVFYGEHFLPSGNGSGWFVWTGENDGSLDFFDMMHARHFIEKFPKIEKYLNLESGWSFVVDLSNGYEDIWFDEKKLVK